MIERIKFEQPDIRFDDSLMRQVAYWQLPRDEVFAAQRGVHPVDLRGGRRSPFAGYSRTLSPAGGLLFHYRERNRTIMCMLLRWTLASFVTLIGLFLILLFAAPSHRAMAIWLVGLALLVLLIAIARVPKWHTIEIRPDGMIVDGNDVYFAEDIGENWPEVQKADGGGNKLVLAGICGTRFIEYVTVNRYDDNDRTPEVLAADLENAMIQLWDRREVTFPSVD